MIQQSKDPSQTERSGIEQFRRRLGPFVVAAETTQMATLFTDGMDSTNTIVFANAAFLDLTGFAYDDILQRPLSDFLADVTDATSVLSMRSAMAAGTSGVWEMQCRRLDATEFLAAVFLSPVRDKAGALRQNVLSVVKLDGHVERLLDQRNEFHAMYEQAPGFIATSEGPDHRFTFANASYRRFVHREDLVGRTVAEAMPEIAAQGFVALLDAVYHTGTPFVGRSMPMTFDSDTGRTETCYSDFVYQAVRDARGTIVGLFCEGYDVTEQRKTAEALAAVQSELIHLSRVNAMGTMATTLAHELNQPLSAIANYTAGARRAVAADADVARLAEALHGIDEATQRAADIIRNLRELTRRREPARERFDLTIAIGECVRLVRATASPSIALTQTVPDPIMVTGDRIQVQQVVINLLRNACDAVVDSEPQHVGITATDRGADTLVRVTDTGPGVPLEVARNIFSWSSSTKTSGMGLGLSISQTIMESHRGRIWLERSGPDGSEFCFSLPNPVVATE